MIKLMKLEIIKSRFKNYGLARDKGEIVFETGTIRILFTYPISRKKIMLMKLL